MDEKMKKHQSLHDAILQEKMRQIQRKQQKQQQQQQHQQNSSQKQQQHKQENDFRQTFFKMEGMDEDDELNNSIDIHQQHQNGNISHSQQKINKGVPNMHSQFFNNFQQIKNNGCDEEDALISQHRSLEVQYDDNQYGTSLPNLQEEPQNLKRRLSSSPYYNNNNIHTNTHYQNKKQLQPKEKQSKNSQINNGQRLVKKENNSNNNLLFHNYEETEEIEKKKQLINLLQNKNQIDNGNKVQEKQQQRIKQIYQQYDQPTEQEIQLKVVQQRDQKKYNSNNDFAQISGEETHKKQYFQEQSYNNIIRGHIEEDEEDQKEDEEQEQEDQCLAFEDEEDMDDTLSEVLNEESQLYRANMTEVYNIKQDFCLCEKELLDSFGYTFDIVTPYHYLDYYTYLITQKEKKSQSLQKNKTNKFFDFKDSEYEEEQRMQNAMKKCLQSTTDDRMIGLINNFLNDSSKMQLCLYTQPVFIFLACFLLSLQVMKINPSSYFIEGQIWYVIFDPSSNLEDFQDITKEIQQFIFKRI